MTSNKESNEAKRSVEAVDCKNESREGLASSSGQSGSENIDLSNANVGENLMSRKPKDSSAKFVNGSLIHNR
ncbi:hypothetical protein CR513_20974, partial [Mucuna pruriens]